MKLLHTGKHFRRLLARPATAAVLTLGLLAAAPQFSSSVSAKASAPSCTTQIGRASCRERV